jgi:hypothetical protein
MRIVSVRALVLLLLGIVAVTLAAAFCEDCDTAARHFLRELFRAVF